MSKASEFKGQWDKFLTIVEADLQKDVEARRQSDHTVVTMIIQRELAKWSISGHYNGAWLCEFKEQYPALGERFEATLKQIRVEPITYTPTSSVPYIGMVVGAPAITLSVLRWVFSRLIHSRRRSYQLAFSDAIVSGSNSLESSPEDCFSGHKLVSTETPAITLPLGWQVAGSLASVLVTAPIARNLWNNQFQRSLSAHILQVRDSLNVYGQRLQKIVAEADREVS